jgi:hypothetical protein
MRATRVFSARPERAIVALAQLCEERKDDEIVQPDGSNQNSPSIPPRMSPMPAQTPHPVGSSPVRLNADAAPHIPQFARDLAYQQQIVAQQLPALPEHSTANRPDWNGSAEAPNVIRSAFADGMDRVYLPNTVHHVPNDVSSDTSDIITDDEMMEAFLDSVDDVRSYSEESPEFTRASSPANSQPPASLLIPSDTDNTSKSFSLAVLESHISDASGPKPNDALPGHEHMPSPPIHLKPPQPAHVIPSRIDTVRRVTPEPASFSALTIPFGYTYSSSSCAYYHRQPASPSSSPRVSNPGNQRQHQPSQCFSHHQSPQTVFYETTGPTPFGHSNRINHPSHHNNGEPPTRHPYYYAYYSASHFHLPFEHPEQQQQQHYEGPIPGPSRQSIFGAGGEPMSVKSLPQHVLSARKRNSRRGSISDGSSGRLSSKEASGSTNGNTRSNTPTTSSMTPPYPRSSSRESSNLSRSPSRAQHHHSNSNVTVKSGTKQYHSGHGQSVQQGYRLRNGSVPSSPIVHQEPLSPFSSPLQHQLPSPSIYKPHLRKDLRNLPLSPAQLNSPLKGPSSQLSNLQGDVSFNDEVPDVAYNSRTSSSPCASVSNGSATTWSAIDSSPGSISSTSSSLQSALNRSMADDSGFEAVSPFQSKIRRLPSSQHGYIATKNGEGGVEVTVEGTGETYRMMRQNLQELRTQRQGGGRDWQSLQGRRSDPMGVQQGVDGQAQLQSEESTRRIRQAWKEYQARRVGDGNGAVYHQPQVGMTVDLEGRKVLTTGGKHGKKW